MPRPADKKGVVVPAEPSRRESNAKSEVYVARQPILDTRQKVFAYELLFRSSRQNVFTATDPTAATSALIANSYLTIGLDRLIGGRRAFINFDRKSLLGGVASTLPKKTVVVEILETVRPDAEILRVCESLKRKGYPLALDDFVCTTGFEPLLDLADIIKVDFRAISEVEIEELTRSLRTRSATLLAEKVETQDEFRRATELGFRLFQGYFFSRPEIVSGRQIPPFKLNYLRILREVGNPELNFRRIEEVVKGDVSLVHKLLRYVNSAHFGWKREVESIRHALALLGETEVRRWISLATLTALATDKPEQLMVDAITRGRFCELMSRRVGLGERSAELFLLGLYSLLDALLDRPMTEVVDEVHLSADVRACLLSKDKPKSEESEAAAEPHTQKVLGTLVSLAEASERAEWTRLESLAGELRVPLGEIGSADLEAVQWSDEIFRGGS